MSSVRISTAAAPRPARPAVAEARQWSIAGPWPEHWPLTVLVLGYPLWWILGVSSFMPIAMAVPMALQLLRRSPIRVPVGFNVWLVFLLWTSGSVLMLVRRRSWCGAGGWSSRFLVFGYRFAWHLTITIVLLWVMNLGERALPTVRVVRLMSVMFLVVVAGGWLGLLLPNVELTSLMEAVLPGALRSNRFVSVLVNPVTANASTILGVTEPRPVAPFAFANAWGSATLMRLPFFVVGWFGRDAGWRRSFAPFVLLVAAVPIVMSLNRAMWASIAVGIIYYVVRLVLKGRMVALVGAVLCVLVAGLLFLASPLAELTVTRLENPHSNERRGNLLARDRRVDRKGFAGAGFRKHP